MVKRYRFTEYHQYRWPAPKINSINLTPKNYLRLHSTPQDTNYLSGFQGIKSKKIIQGAMKIGDFCISAAKNWNNADPHNFSHSCQKPMRGWETLILIDKYRFVKSELRKNPLWKVAGGQNFPTESPKFHNFDRDNQATASNQSLRGAIKRQKTHIV